MISKYIVEINILNNIFQRWFSKQQEKNIFHFAYSNYLIRTYIKSNKKLSNIIYDTKYISTYISETEAKEIYA